MEPGNEDRTVDPVVAGSSPVGLARLYRRLPRAAAARTSIAVNPVDVQQLHARHACRLLHTVDVRCVRLRENCLTRVTLWYNGRGVGSFRFWRLDFG